MRVYLTAASTIGVLVAVAVLFATSWGSTEPVPDGSSNGNAVPRDRSCGPQSLWIATRRLGAPVEWDRVSSAFKDGSTNGTTLRDLTGVAASLGLHAETKRVSWNELTEHAGTAIIFVNGNHFVAVDCREQGPDGSIRVYDPNSCAEWMVRAELEAIWQGESLLLRLPDDWRIVDDFPLVLDTCYLDSHNTWIRKWGAGQPSVTALQGVNGYIRIYPS